MGGEEEEPEKFPESMDVLFMIVVEGGGGI